jgi:putative membrane protein
MSKAAWAVVVGIVLLIILVIGFSLLTPFGWGNGYGPGWGMMGGFGFPFFGGIMMLLFWVLIIIGAVWLFQALARGGGLSTWSGPSRESPLDILKARYARGEISKEQFEEMKRTLGV